METANRQFLANVIVVRTAHKDTAPYISSKDVRNIGYPNKSLDPFPRFQFDQFLSGTKNPSKERSLFPSRMNLANICAVVLRFSPLGICAHIAIHLDHAWKRNV